MYLDIYFLFKIDMSPSNLFSLSKILLQMSFYITMSSAFISFIRPKMIASILSEIPCASKIGNDSTSSLCENYRRSRYTL